MSEPSQENLVQPLRTEIIESQKARIDLLKYKLIAVATLGTLGLGLQQSQPHPLLLGLIPLVCIYIDLLCYHNTLRILVIGQYLKREGCKYENFLGNTGNRLSQIGLFLLRIKVDKSIEAKLGHPKPCSPHCGDIDRCAPNLCSIDGLSKNKYYVNLSQIEEHTAHRTCAEEKQQKFKLGAGYFFQLEDWALNGSTDFLSAVLTVFSVIKLKEFIILRVAEPDFWTAVYLPCVLLLPSILICLRYGLNYYNIHTTIFCSFCFKATIFLLLISCFYYLYIKEITFIEDTPPTKYYELIGAYLAGGFGLIASFIAKNEFEVRKNALFNISGRLQEVVYVR